MAEVKRFRVLSIALCVVMLVTAGCGSDQSAAPDSPKGEALTEASDNAGDVSDGHDAEMPGEEVSSVEASSMRLVRTEGTVSLTDENDEELTPVIDMRLFSGNSVETEDKSLAGISLDDVKAAVIGEKSLTRLHQDGKKLAMDLESGTMYFSVAKPLADEESFEISTASMTLGIRGTSGFISAVSDTQSVVILTSGRAVITGKADGQTMTIEPGRRVTVTVMADGTTYFMDEPVRPAEYPSLLIDELGGDDVMLREVDEQNGGGIAEELSAIAVYRGILYRADTFDYHTEGGLPTGKYEYALVPMNGSPVVPALLLAQETDAYISYVRVFQYDADSGGVLAPEESLTMGAAQLGGYRGGIQMMNDGNGLRSVAISGGTGTMEINRITFRDKQMVTESVWSGRVGDGMPEDLMGTDIDWRDLTSLDVLNQGFTTALPTDGDRIVFTGTIDHYTYDEVVALQGEPDPYGYERDTESFHIILLDTPMYMTIANMSSPEMTTYLVKMIRIGNEDLSKYDGQHHIFSIDPSATHMPGEPVLPFGQPGTGNIHVLSAPQEAAENGFSASVIAGIKAQLGVPSDLATEDRIYYDEASYWEAGGVWLVQCEFYHNGELVAGASVDRDTGNVMRNIMVYGTDSAYDPVMSYDPMAGN